MSKLKDQIKMLREILDALAELCDDIDIESIPALSLVEAPDCNLSYYSVWSMVPPRVIIEKLNKRTKYKIQPCERSTGIEIILNTKEVTKVEFAWDELYIKCNNVEISIQTDFNKYIPELVKKYDPYIEDQENTKEEE